MSLRDIYERTFDEDIYNGEQSGPACPECGGIVHTNSIKTACEDCGLVVEDRPIDQGPEWRAFDDDERDRRERTGPPLTPTRPDRGLSGALFGSRWLVG
jgi:transcription initiation factor TFIIB